MKNKPIGYIIESPFCKPGLLLHTMSYQRRGAITNFCDNFISAKHWREYQKIGFKVRQVLEIKLGK